MAFPRLFSVLNEGIFLNMMDGKWIKRPLMSDLGSKK